MLVIHIPENNDLWDPRNRIFLKVKETTLKLEHSLISVSKWESRWKKAYANTKKTPKMLLDYVRCMTLNAVDPLVYNCLTQDDIKKIIDYMEDPMTATVITSRDNKKIDDDIITSELIYYYMAAFNIPFECEKWHFNRLLTLIRVCSEKNKPPKKMSQKDLYARQKAINARNKAKYHTRG